MSVDSELPKLAFASFGHFPAPDSDFGTVAGLFKSFSLRELEERVRKIASLAALLLDPSAFFGSGSEKLPPSCAVKKFCERIERSGSLPGDADGDSAEASKN